MGTELAGPCINDDNMDIPSIPPGFESLTSFTLRRVENNETATSSLDYASASSMHATQVETEFECSDDTKIMRSLRRRPWIKDSGCDDSSGIESDCEKNPVCKPRLPKGVIRGCEKCSNCQKVIARWSPEEDCRPDLQEAPVFYPTEEEFKDTLKYIASIRLEAEAYGICRIVPPPSWKPPCPLKEKNIWEHSKFITRIQRIDKLQNRDSVGKLLKNNNHKSKKRRKCTKTGVDHGTSDVNNPCPGEAGMFEAERFGFDPGPAFTLEAFKNYANDFKAQYFRKNENTANLESNTWEPSVENIESEYWRMVEKPTEEIEVLYGADLETGVFGSGFPKISCNTDSTSDEKYVKSGWNLNNFPRLTGSVLSYENSDISGVLVPWLYIGMCFSSFCWHVEDHHLYSMNCMHWGVPKIWYGVPGADALKLEAAMRKHLPDLFEEQPDLLHKLVTQLSPSVLKAEGVPVYRCVQNPGEFVLTFPRAYHSGFNCGFNCAEAVNVAPVDWLLHGQNAIELYREQGRKTSISHDKLLLGAARDAVKAHWELNLLRKKTPDNLRWKSVCGKDGILSKALKTRVEMEHLRREFLCKSSQALKMESNFDANCERECSVCLFDLHLSAAGCHYCSPDKYACLNHVKQLCLCSWGAKFFLFRYDMNELNILVEALEGKLGAIYRWARLDLGLALTSYVSKENLQVPALIGRLPYLQEGTHLKEKLSLPFIPSLKEQKGKEEVQNSDEVVNKAFLLQKEKPSGELLTLGNKNYVSTLVDQCKREESTNLGSTLMNPTIQLSQRDVENMDGITAEKPEMKKSALLGSGDVILLSDDEDEESSITVSGRAKDNNAMNTGFSQRLVVPSDASNSGNCTQNSVLPDPMTNASLMVVATVNSSPDGETAIHTPISECVEDEDHEKGETLLCSNSQNLYCPELITFSGDCDKNVHGISHTKETSGLNVGNTVTNIQCPLICGNGNPNDEEMHKRMGSDSNSRSADEVQTGSCNLSSNQNNLDGYLRQKGPRIARVVRRFSCNVEPLDYGIVHPGKCWCDRQAIYPKGFRSRVRYMSVLDPTIMCHYVSEILDAGHDGPLFMVSLEQCPSEVFVHVSAARCWEMVRERLNQEITKQHKLGRLKLPPLQPPGSLDGMEMFGLSSPAIVQVIQEMDCNRVCTEYWKSRPQMQTPQLLPSKYGSVNLCTKLGVSNNQQENQSYSLPSGVDTIVAGVFKKANPEELHALYRILDDKNSAYQGLVTRLLNEEINKRQI